LCRSRVVDVEIIDGVVVFDFDRVDPCCTTGRPRHNTTMTRRRLRLEEISYNYFMAFSAFEQFEIVRLVPIHPFGNLDISITNSTLFMLLAFTAVYLLYRVTGLGNVEGGYIVPSR